MGPPGRTVLLVFCNKLFNLAPDEDCQEEQNTESSYTPRKELYTVQSKVTRFPFRNGNYGY